MESIQPVRPPMSQQPPQRIDVDNQQQTQQQQQTSSLLGDKTAEMKQATKQQQRDKRDSHDNIPDVDISLAYKRKSLKHRIECGTLVTINNDEIEELKRILGVRKCQMYKNHENMSSCVVCDEQCDNQRGEFAVETVLFIPNKNDPAYDNLGRFRIELPRISCHECSAEYATANNIRTNNNNNNNNNDIILSLGQTWQNYQNGNLKSNINNNNNNNINKPSSHSSAQSASLSGVGNIAGIVSPVGAGNPNDDDNKIDNNNNNNNNNISNDNNNNNKLVCDNSNNNNNNNNNNRDGAFEAERDPFDDGFLICTQLVKTGGADQGGLQVGDVFVEFGHYSKKRFPGLKSIANLVRRSAGKEINVVVWRKLEVKTFIYLFVCLYNE